MKRNALSTSLKDRNFVTSRNMKESSSSKIIGRESWEWNHQDYMDGFAWPPRSYTCSFCMREFRSAQALGGHMNVHRRDRARLRQSPPPPQPRSNNHHCISSPNPNPNFPSSSASFAPTFPSRNNKSFALQLTTLAAPSFSPSSRLSSSSPIEMQKLVGHNHFSPQTPELSFYQDNQNENYFALTAEDRSKIMNKKKKEIVRLDLEIGLFHESNEDLDLELRLGSS